MKFLEPALVAQTLNKTPRSSLRVLIDKEGPTELVQHFDYIGSLHRRKGAAGHITDMVWVYCTPWPIPATRRRGSFTCSKMIFTCHRGAYRKGGWGRGMDERT
jgi:hypothetical protein